MKRKREAPNQLSFMHALFATATAAKGGVTSIEKARFEKGREKLLNSLYRSGLMDPPNNR